MRKTLRVLVPMLAILSGCNSGGGPAPAPASPDGITLTTATTTRLTGAYHDAAGNVLAFDRARTGDDLYFDLRGNDGRAIIHIETVGDNYEFSYMNGALTMHTTKEFVAAARAQATTTADGVSTDGFVWDGDRNALDAMLQLPEVSQLPFLSRALGARGITGNAFPASLALHKAAKQSAEALGINVEKLDTALSSTGYCEDLSGDPYGNQCDGMCGYGCSCWGWVCGDCCWHYGCAVHDSWCRNGQWYYCYNITAVIALFGC